MIPSLPASELPGAGEPTPVPSLGLTFANGSSMQNTSLAEVASLMMSMQNPEVFPSDVSRLKLPLSKTHRFSDETHSVLPPLFHDQSDPTAPQTERRVDIDPSLPGFATSSDGRSESVLVTSVSKQKRTDSAFTEEAIPLFVVLRLHDQELEETSRVNLQRFPNSSELMMTPEGEIMAGSFAQLIIYLTDPDTVNLEFQQQFLLTFPSYTTERNVLAALMMRFFVNTENPKVNIAKDKVKSMRDRIIRVLSKWLSMTIEPSALTMQVVATFQDVLKSFPTSHWFEIISKTSKRIMRSSMQIGKAPAMILPKIPEPWKLLDISPEELARHLTIVHWRIFGAITPELLLREIWGEHSEALTASLKRLTDHFNRLASTITHSILNPENIQDRSAAYCHWAEVAIHLHNLRNYHGLFCTILGLHHRSILRLTDTTAVAAKKLGKKRKKALAQLSTLCQIDNDYQVYREEITNAVPPSIPFIGCFQKDMIYIGETYPNSVENLINFSKCRVSVKLVNAITRFQNAKYVFDQHPAIISLVTDLPPEVDLVELMKLSTSREGKKK